MIGIMAIKGMQVINAIKSTSSEVLTNQNDIQEEWLALPYSTQHLGEDQLFWALFGYVICDLLERNAPADFALVTFNEWQSVITSNESLSTKEYWIRLFDLAKSYFPKQYWICCHLIDDKRSQ